MYNVSLASEAGSVIGGTGEAPTEVCIECTHGSYLFWQCKEYYLCGPSNTVSVQLFSINELYEMRYIIFLIIFIIKINIVQVC